MAFESEIPSPQGRTGPKLFTEYTTQALVALICQIGIVIVGLTLFLVAGLTIVFLAMLFPLTFFIVGILMFAAAVVTIYQAYLGWKLHKGEVSVATVIKVDAISLILCIAGFLAFVITNYMLILIAAQVFAGVIVLDVIAIVLLRDENVRDEFEDWWRNGDQSSEFAQRSFQE